LKDAGTAELLARVEDRLRRWQIVLPAPGTLERIVSSEVTRATATLFDTIVARLSDRLRTAIDILVEVPDGDAIKGDIVRLAPAARPHHPERQLLPVAAAPSRAGNTLPYIFARLGLHSRAAAFLSHEIRHRINMLSVLSCFCA
jgi:hypothetical protein